MEGIQYIGEYLQYMQGYNISTVGVTSVLWTSGGYSVQWGNIFNFGMLAIEDDEKISIFCITK